VNPDIQFHEFASFSNSEQVCIIADFADRGLVRPVCDPDDMSTSKTPIRPSQGWLDIHATKTCSDSIPILRMPRLRFLIERAANGMLMIMFQQTHIKPTKGIRPKYWFLSGGYGSRVRTTQA